MFTRRNFLLVFVEKTEGLPNSSESSYQQNSNLQSDETQCAVCVFMFSHTLYALWSSVCVLNSCNALHESERRSLCSSVNDFPALFTCLQVAFPASATRLHVITFPPLVTLQKTAKVALNYIQAKSLRKLFYVELKCYVR